MELRAHRFKSAVRAALADPDLQEAMADNRRFAAHVRRQVAASGGFRSLRDQAKAIKDHTLAHLDHYLEAYEAAASRRGVQVHWAATPEDAQARVVEICRSAGARRIIKGKTMIGEEMGINAALARAGLQRVETDLGEYILQLADEPPSHINGPAIHKTLRQVQALFHQHHQALGRTHYLQDPAELLAEARRLLRDRFLDADVGITGANFLIAEDGRHVLVTNEGNGDLASLLPRVRIVLASIEKVLPSLADAGTHLQLLALSATGQPLTSYTSFYGGPLDDGPEECHVVLLDNGRSEMLAGAFRPMLRCIRCAACMDNCPVYNWVGGHAYGWIYPGPMGSVWTPNLTHLEGTRDLPNACTLNGRCKEVCPMQIPLPDMLRELRNRQWQWRLVPATTRWGLRLWAALARRPRLYRAATALLARLMKRASGNRGYLRHLPLAGNWTATRDMPAPQGATFQQRWKQRKQADT
ncbi:lactate utilization protein B [Metapseudomonas furukawaii]|uniref:Predicted L-lactate dehydrogenase n=1 Tax=Metapseudomonas furukawaii TaxID=1149133 RepID=A0AAD1FG18_METFU|nr:lactate utilization protein B [Pseudomonas furukawaii]ELS25250.1 putative L-lactate dehydrogenase, Iron-sulfur cluster-binding subunit YkgF [Pseudomonas furukawaii]BAU74609.1 predicted L-lactate dehydrogenase [Pseudomonas furukawaii]